MFFRGDLALFAFALAAVFLIAFARVMKHRWLLGVAVAAWFGYGIWELYLLRGTYLRLDLVYLWPLLFLVSVFTIVWMRAEDCDGTDRSAPANGPHE